jgi:hypothetical protein
MKKVVFLLCAMLFIANVFSQDIIPAASLNSYFANQKFININKKEQSSLNCNTAIISGQRYSGITGSVFVPFTFTTVLTLHSNFSPSPTMGAGYFFSWGSGTGNSDGSLNWTSKIGAGLCWSTGFKPTSLSSMPANFGIYVQWKIVGVGFYRDVVNGVWGLSFGTAVNLTQIESSVFSLKCLQSN